jgi:glycerol-3-phosphate dehydrogenase
LGTNRVIPLDVTVFGGGIAGLWLLDELVRRGYSVLLLERGPLGSGQTVASQGIIHGGLKYTFEGWLNASAEAIREMPAIWRDCLAGRRPPDLCATRIRSEFCHLWRTRTIRSQLGMIGARIGLRTKPVKLERPDWPPVLAQCPGDVFRVDEQVVDAVSLVDDLARQYCAWMLKIDAERGLQFELGSGQRVRAVCLTDPGAGGRVLELRPKSVVFTAGAGNAELRERVGLTAEAMQRRPLHMVMLRGDLPELYGHCADGAKTRVTITSAKDSVGRTIWQVGGQVSEDGVKMSSSELIAHARRELQASIPTLDLTGTEATTYRVDRAEAATPGRTRPADIGCRREGNIITAWPTKLALAPRLAERIIGSLDSPMGGAREWPELTDWPRPTTAPPPWESEQAWFRGA